MKTKKFLIGLLSLACVTAGSFGLVACGDNSAQTSEPTEIEAAYAQYVVYAEAQGQTPLSYEAWLATIKGEKGIKAKRGRKVNLLIKFGWIMAIRVPKRSS